MSAFDPLQTLALVAKPPAMTRSFSLLALILAGCVTEPYADTAPRAALRSAVQVASNGDVESFYGVPTSLTVSGLKRLPYEVATGQEMGEGESETYYMITGIHGVEVKVVFHDNGKLYLAQSESSKAIGSRGVGVGSSLLQVKTAWPSGKLFYGSEDGRFVTFDTGTNLLYNFDERDMPPAAFDHPPKGVIVPNLRVKRIRIFAR